MVWIAQQSFASGEISPSVYGLVSSSQYRNGCQSLVNAILTPTGAARKRYGTEVVETVTGGYPAAVFFYFAKGRQYVVQFVSQDDDIGDLNTTFRQVRVLDCVTRAFVNFGDNAAHGPFDAFGDTTAHFHHFTASQLPKVYAFQDNQRIYFCHPDRPPLYLERQTYNGVERWDYGIAPKIQNTPTIVNYQLDAQITEKPTLNGLESNLDIFEKGDEQAYWRVGGPSANDPSTFVFGAWYQTLTYESRTSMAGGRVYGVPGADPSDWVGPYLPNSATVTFTLDADSTSQNDSRTVTSSSAIVKENLIGTPFTISSIMWIVTDVTSSTVFTATRIEGGLTILAAGGTGEFLAVGGLTNLAGRSYLKVNPSYATGVSGVVNLHNATPVYNLGGLDDPWLPDGHENTFDKTTVSVGGTVHMNGGIAALTGLTTNNGPAGTEPVYAAVVARTLGHRGPSLMWGLGQSEAVGFPSCGTTHQGRLWFGGYAERPTKLVASRSFDSDDFTTGSLDDDALELTIADPLGGKVSWMESTTDLLVGTATAEFALSGRPITPSNFASERQSGYGSRNVRPALVGPAAVFVDGGGKGLREMTFFEERQRYQSPDLTDLAKHIFEDIVIEEVAYVSAPAQILYVKDTNNLVYALSIWRLNGVAGWSRFTQPIFPTDTGTSTESSTIESITAVRADGVNITTDELWIVRRFTSVGQSAAGTVVRKIERMTPDFAMDMTFTDTTPTSTTIGSGVHLLDLPVSYRPQGMVQKTASDPYVYIGDFAISNISVMTHPDVGFTPANSRIGREVEFKLVPVIQHLTIQGEGDTQGRLEKLRTAIILLRESIGGTLAGGNIMPPGVEVPDATTLSAEVAAVTAWRKVLSTGTYGSMHDVEIVHRPPYHFEVAGINMQLEHGK